MGQITQNQAASDAIVERDLKIWQLRVKGLSQAKIGLELGIARETVNRSIKRTMQELHQEMNELILEQKFMQTAQLEHLYEEAIGAWNASKEGSTERTLRTVGGGTADPDPRNAGEGKTEQIIKQMESSGDFKYLIEARAALKDIRDIWGIEAPKKKTTSGMTVTVELDFSQLDDEQLSEFERLLAGGEPAQRAYILAQQPRLLGEGEARTGETETPGTAGEVLPVIDIGQDGEVIPQEG